MSEVRLTVGGREYKVQCEDGQEDHVRHLATVVDERLDRLGAGRSHFDAKNLLFAALMLADELQEHQTRTSAPDDSMAERLEALADELERAADRLEQDGKGSYIAGGGTARHEPHEYP